MAPSRLCAAPFADKQVQPFGPVTDALTLPQGRPGPGKNHDPTSLSFMFCHLTDLVAETAVMSCVPRTTEYESVNRQHWRSGKPVQPPILMVPRLFEAYLYTFTASIPIAEASKMPERVGKSIVDMRRRFECECEISLFKN
jgi:hypothetical protein